MYFPRKRVFWSVGLGHLTNDVFMSMGIVLLTFLSASVVPMSNVQIGFAISATQIAGAITQPVFGIYADRTGGRWLGAGGLAITVSMFMLSLIVAITTHNYILMLIPFVLQGVGSGAVHPVGMLNAAESNEARAASNMSYFFLLGQAGLAIGPALLGLILDAANADALVAYTNAVGLPGVATIRPEVSPIFLMFVLAIPGIAMMATSIPVRQHQDKTKTPEPTKSTAERIALPIMPFIIIGIMVMLRGLAQPGSVNFIPVLFQEKGWSPAQYGLITSFFWIASGISGVVFGNLADHYDRRYIMTVSMVLSAPAFFLLPVFDGVLAFVLAVAAGGFSGGAHSIIVVLTQDLIPANKGFASGAILGFIFGTGALGSLIIGAVADSIGLGTTFQLVAVMAVASGLMALLLPKND